MKDVITTLMISLVEKRNPENDYELNSPAKLKRTVDPALIDFAYLVNSSLQNNEDPLKRLKS